MKKFFVLFCCLSLVLLYGCAIDQTNGIKLVNGKPYWFYTPSKDGHIGGVGISGIHVDGKTGQKTLATERALEEIARQMGVKVDSYSTLRSVSNGVSSSVAGDTTSFFTVDGKEVKATIEQMWEDPYTHELYVWMVAQQ